MGGAEGRMDLCGKACEATERSCQNTKLLIFSYSDTLMLSCSNVFRVPRGLLRTTHGTDVVCILDILPPFPAAVASYRFVAVTCHRHNL